MEKVDLSKYNNNNFNVMSYNVRCCNDTLRNGVDGTIKTRVKYIIKNILLYMPDTIGFQEVTISNNPKEITWDSLLKEGLKDYYLGVGKGRDIDRKISESNPIFYNKNKFELIDHGTKWLSPDPDIPGSRFDSPWDGCKRILTYVILKNKINNITYMHVNTHLDYKYYENRIRQIKVVIDFISKFNEKYPILLTGDFNCGNEKWEIEQGDAVPYLLNNGFFDASKEAKDCCISWTFPSIGYHQKVYGSCLKRKKHKNGINLDDQKFCESECDEENGKIIDFCFRSNDKICFHKYKVITDYEACGGISSDHYPIYIEGSFINISN